MSKLEKLKAIHTLEKDLSQDQLIDLLKKIDFKPSEYQNRIKGIYKENEFLIVLKSLNIVKSIIKTDEAPNRLFGMNTTDIELELSNGNKLLVEIKSKNINKSNEISFSTQYLNSLEEFANSKDLEVVFVVCILNFWMAFKLEYVKQNNNKISIDDYGCSILDEVFGLQSYVFFKGIEMKTVYCKSKMDSLINHNKYGGLVSQTLIYKGKKIYKYNGKNNLNFLLCCEELHSRLEETNIISREDYTTEMRGIKNSEAIVIQEIDMVLSTIYHSVDDNNKPIFIDEEVNQSAKNNKHYFNVAQYRKMFDEFSKLGLYYLIIRDSKLYRK